MAVSDLGWTGVLSRVGPARHPGLPGQAPDTCDPELGQQVGKLSYLAFIDLS